MLQPLFDFLCLVRLGIGQLLTLLTLLFWMTTARAWDATKGYAGEGPGEADLQSQSILELPIFEPNQGDQPAREEEGEDLSQLVLAIPMAEEKDLEPCDFDRFKSKGGVTCAACNRNLPRLKFGYECKTCKKVHVCDRKCQRTYEAHSLPCIAKMPPDMQPKMSPRKQL